MSNNDSRVVARKNENLSLMAHSESESQTLLETDVRFAFMPLTDSTLVSLTSITDGNTSTESHKELSFTTQSDSDMNSNTNTNTKDIMDGSQATGDLEPNNTSHADNFSPTRNEISSDSHFTENKENCRQSMNEGRIL